jgi:hypothetical protein
LQQEILAACLLPAGTTVAHCCSLKNTRVSQKAVARVYKTAASCPNSGKEELIMKAERDAGLYLIRDAAEAGLDLPSGQYEIPLIIQDRSFNPDASRHYPDEWEEDVFRRLRKNDHRVRLLVASLMGMISTLSFRSKGEILFAILAPTT